MGFIDYKKAFDSVKTSAVMQALRQQGVDELYIKVLGYIYRDSTATIQLQKKSRKIPINKSVIQDDKISPKLFTPCFEEIFKKLELLGIYKVLNFIIIFVTKYVVYFL